MSKKSFILTVMAVLIIFGMVTSDYTNTPYQLIPSMFDSVEQFNEEDHPVLATGAGWLSGWQYRRMLTIDGHPGAGTNYQIYLDLEYGAGTDSGRTVYCNSHCQTDFGDVRFTDDDGSTELDYWIQEYTASGDATVWVEVADNLDTNQDIWLYYGTSETSSTTDSLEDTFLTGSEFSSAPSSTILLDCEDADWTVSSGWLDFSDGVADLGTNLTSWHGISTNVSEEFNFAEQTDGIRFRWRQDFLNNVHPPLTYFYFEMYEKDTYADQMWVRTKDSQATMHGTWQIYDEISLTVAYQPTADNAYEGGEGTILGGYDCYEGDGYDVWSYYGGDSGIGTLVDTDDFDSDWTFDAVEIWCWQFQDKVLYPTQKIDWFFVAKYVHPDPAVLSAAPEVQSYGSSWLTGWDYRKRFTVGYVAGAGDNYQIDVLVEFGSGTDGTPTSTVYCASVCQTDFGDIRFTESDGITPVPYWMEEYTASDDATFWIAFDCPPSGVDYGYIYYGATDTVQTSGDVEETFVAGSDFRDYPNTYQDLYGSDTYWGITDSTWLYAADYGTNAGYRGPNTNHTEGEWSFSAVGGFRFKAKQKWASTDVGQNGQMLWMFKDGATSLGYVAYTDWWGAAWGHTMYKDYIVINDYMYEGGASQTDTVVQELRHVAGTSTDFWCYEDGSLVDSQDVDSDWEGCDGIFVQILMNDGGPVIPTLYIDYFFLGEYLVIEPYPYNWQTVDTSLPTNDDAEITNVDDTDNMYAKYKNYTLEVSVTSPLGFQAINYVEATLWTGAAAYWTVRYTQDTDTFSEETGGDYIELFTAISTNTSSGTGIDLVFSLEIDWDHNDVTDYDIKCYVLDIYADSDTDTFDLDYDVETRLDWSAAPTLNDGSGTGDRGDYNEEDSITATGTLIYYTSGDNTPPNDEVDVWVSCANVSGSPWSDLELASGVCSMTVDSDDVVVANSRTRYTFKPVISGDGAGGTSLYWNAPDATDDYMADSLTVTITGPTDNRQNIGSNASGIVVSAVYDYDGGAFDGTITLNDTDYNGDGVVEIAYFTGSAGTGDTHGVTKIGTNDDTYMIWDALTCYVSVPDDQRIDINANCTGLEIWAIYEYDSNPYDGTLALNDTTYDYGTVGIYYYNVTTANGDDTYGISTISNNGNQTYCIFDALTAYVAVPDDQRIDINANCTGIEIWAVYDYDSTTYDGTLTLNDTTYDYGTVGIYYYNVTTADGDDTYGITVLMNTGNQTYCIFDALTAYIAVPDDQRIDVSTNCTGLELWAVYDYDSTTYDGTLTLNDTTYDHSTVGIYYYNVTTANGDDTYGITVLMNTGNQTYCIFDRIEVHQASVSDSRTNVDDLAGAVFWLRLDYDNHAVDSASDTIYINSTEATYNVINWYWYTTQNTVGNWTFIVTSGSEDTYGITALSADSLTLYMQWVVWDKVQVQSYTANDTRDNINDYVNVTVLLYYDYDDTTMTDGTVTINGESATHIADGYWYIEVTSASVTSVTYNNVQCTGNTYGITNEDQNSQSQEIIWDQIEVYSDGFDYPWARVNIGQNITIWALARLDYDDHALGAGDYIEFGDERMTWNGTHFTASYTKWSVANWNFTINATASYEGTYGITVGSNNPVNITFDRVLIYNMWVATFLSPDNRSDIESAVYLYASFVSEFDNESMGVGVVYINSTLMSNYDDDVWRLSWMENSVGNYTFIVTSLNWTVYNITEINYNGWNVTYLYNIYDRIVAGAYWSDDAQNRTYTGDTILYYAYFYYDWDDVNVSDASGTVMQIYGNSTTNWTTYTGTYDSGNARWYYSDCVGSVRNYTFGVGHVGFIISTDGLYGLTYEANPNSESFWFVWDKVKWMSTTLNTTQDYSTTGYRVNISDYVNITVLLQYEYDNTAVTDGTMTLNGESLTHIANGYWYLMVQNASVAYGQDYTFDTIAADGDTYDIESENQNSQTATVIWDQIAVQTLAATDTQIDTTETTTLNATLQTVYDKEVIGSGDNVYINGSSMTWDSDHWYYTIGPLGTGVYYYIITAAWESGDALYALNTNSTSATVYTMCIVVSGYTTNSTDDRDDINSYYTVNVTLEYSAASYNPDVIDLNTGTYDSGDLDSFTANDADYYVFYEVTGSPGFMFYFNVTVENNLFRRVEFYAWYDGNVGHTIYVQIYNYTLGDWYSLGTLDDDEDFDWHNYTVCSCSDYVIDNIVMFRLNHASPGNTGHSLSIDYLALSGNLTAMTDGTVTINGYSFTHIDSGVWQHNITAAIASSVTFNAVVVSGNSYGITTVCQDGQTKTVIWDSLTITIVISDQRINVNANASTIVVSAVYDYDSTTYDGTLTLNDTDYNGDGTVTIWYYTVQTANGDDTYAITEITVNDNDYVIWDQIDIYNLGVSDYYQDINVNVIVSCNALLEYDSHELGTGDTITFNSVSMTWNGTHFTSTVTEASTGYYEYTFATTGNEVTYGITVVDTWQWIWDCTNVTGWNWNVQQPGDTLTSDGTFMTYHFLPTAGAQVSRIYYTATGANMTYVDYTVFFYLNKGGSIVSGWNGAGMWEDPVPATSAFTINLNLLSSYPDTQWFMVEGTCNASVAMNRIWISWISSSPDYAACDLKFCVIALSARPYVAIVFDDVNVEIDDLSDQILYTGETAASFTPTGEYDWGGESYDGTINTNWTATQTTPSNYTFVVTTLDGDDTYGISTIGTNDDSSWIVWDKINLTITSNYDWSVVGYNVTLSATGIFYHLGWTWNGTETYNSSAVQYANQTTVAQYYYGNTSISSITDPDYGVITFNVVTPEYVVWDNVTGTVLISPGAEIGGNIPFTVFVYNLTWQYNDSYVDSTWDFEHIDNDTLIATVDSDGTGYLSPPLWIVVQPATDEAWDYSSNATATIGDGRTFDFQWYSEDAIDVEEDFSITSPVYSESEEEWVLSAYSNKDFTYIIYENDTQRSTGSKTEGSFRISYPKNTTEGLWRWAIKATDGTDTLWINGSYTVGDTANTYSWIYLNLYGPDGIGIDPLLFKIYVNDTRIYSGNPQFFGPIGDAYNVTILNYLNETIVNDDYTVSERMIDVALDVYTLFVYNQLDEEFIWFNLTSSGGATWRMYIAPRSYRDVAIYASTDYTYTFTVITGGEGGTFSGTVNIDYDYGIIINGVSMVDIFRGIEQIDPTGSGRLDSFVNAVAYVFSGPLTSIQFMIWIMIGLLILGIYIVPYLRKSEEGGRVSRKKVESYDDGDKRTSSKRREPVPRQLKKHTFKDGPLNPKYEGRDILQEMGDSIWKKLRGEN